MVKLKKFSVGEKVFAKVKGYPPWPAKITKVDDPTGRNPKYHVEYYGTREIGTCKTEDLYNYVENKSKLTKNVKKKTFLEGIVQLENDLTNYSDDIPPENNSLNDISSAENVTLPDASIAEDSMVKGHESMLETSTLPFGTDSDAETGNLIIDEGGKKKAIKRKSTNPMETPDPKKKKGRKSHLPVLNDIPSKNTGPDSAVESQDEETERKVVSRSGRKIKPKRFHDSIETDLPTDPTKNDEDKKTSPKDDKTYYDRVHLLRTESTFLSLDTQIRSSLSLEQANTDVCLEAMEKMGELELTPLMLKKHAHVVETMKRLRRYIGNTRDWKFSDHQSNEFIKKAEMVQKHALVLYEKFRSLFEVSKDQPFWKNFTSEVEKFNNATKGKSKEEIFSMVIDPTAGPARSNNNMSALSNTKVNVLSEVTSNNPNTDDMEMQ